MKCDRALLLDCELAHFADEASLTISGDFVGTPYYASSEQLGRERRPHRRLLADVDPVDPW